MSEESAAAPYELPIEVADGDIDVLGHVNNVVYLRWVQEAAIAHWNAATDDEMKAEAVWVVARHEIDYRAPALPGDSLVARTWIGGLRGRAFERHTEIVRPADSRVLARALTFWVPLDPATGRPARASERLRRRFSIPDPE